MMLYDEFVERRDPELTCKFPSMRQADTSYEDFCVDEYTSYVEAYVHASREALNRMSNSAQLIGEPVMEYQEIVLTENEIPY